MSEEREVLVQAMIKACENRLDCIHTWEWATEDRSDICRVMRLDEHVAADKAVDEASIAWGAADKVWREASDALETFNKEN